MNIDSAGTPGPQSLPDHEILPIASAAASSSFDLPKVLDLKPGELVEIRSAAEVAVSLDADGKLDGLPFMPEMQKYCGRQFHVSRRADSTCAGGQPRRIENTVHLEAVRCDGSAHYGCQAACLILWKEAWLQRVFESPNGNGHPAAQNGRAPASIESAEPNLNGHAVDSDRPSLGLAVDSERPGLALEQSDKKLVCQATELSSASCPLLLGRTTNYLAGVVRDCRSAKIGGRELRVLWAYTRGKLVLSAFTAWARAPWNAERYKKTPSEQLDLRVGELVQVRSAREILRTLDRKGCNRGMEFKAEMFQFCGRKFPVLARMERRIDERTGLMRKFRNECILLAAVHCHGQRSFCARSNYHYWREIWLRRC
jgi:hypothetical protein